MSDARRADLLAAGLVAGALLLHAWSWSGPSRLSREQLVDVLVEAELRGTTPLREARRRGIRDRELGHAAHVHDHPDLEAAVAAELARRRGAAGPHRD